MKKTPGQISNEMLYGYGVGAKKDSKSKIDIGQTDKALSHVDTSVISLEERSFETRKTFALAEKYRESLQKKWEEYISFEDQFGSNELQEKALIEFINSRDAYARHIREDISAIYSKKNSETDDIKTEKEKRELQDILIKIEDFHCDFTDAFYEEADLIDEKAA